MNTRKNKSKVVAKEFRILRKNRLWFRFRRQNSSAAVLTSVKSRAII